MKIRFTGHALDKFELLSKRGFKTTKAQVLKTLRQPEDIDTQTDYPKVIVSKEIDKKHVLRVVYKHEGDIITIITFYPAEKGRYYEI